MQPPSESDRAGSVDGRQFSIPAAAVAQFRLGTCGIVDNCLEQSDCHSEFFKCGGQTERPQGLGVEFVVASREVLDEGMPAEDNARGPVRLQPAHRPQPGFQLAVIGLEAAVLILHGVVEPRGDGIVD